MCTGVHNPILLKEAVSMMKNILLVLRLLYTNEGGDAIIILLNFHWFRVYGGNKKIPFSTDDKVDNPVSLYAVTKKSNELLDHSYSKLYNIPSTGLRFFTVSEIFSRDWWEQKYYRRIMILKKVGSLCDMQSGAVPVIYIDKNK